MKVIHSENERVRAWIMAQVDSPHDAAQQLYEEMGNKGDDHYVVIRADVVDYVYNLVIPVDAENWGVAARGSWDDPGSPPGQAHRRHPGRAAHSLPGARRAGFYHRERRRRPATKRGSSPAGSRTALATPGVDDRSPGPGS